MSGWVTSTYQLSQTLPRDPESQALRPVLEREINANLVERRTDEIALTVIGIEVAQRVPLAELPAVHAQAATGKLPGGKTVIVAPGA